jgi:hypothetical protein
MEALKEIPDVETPLQTQRGDAVLQKTDIFKKILWFGYENENSWIPVEADRVKAILELNKKGEKPATLEEDEIEVNLDASQALNKDLERMDSKFKKKDKRTKKNKRWGKKRDNRNRNNNANK